MELLTVNISGKVRRAELFGREHFVVPMSMIVADSVLNGSQGPVFYSREENSKSAPLWNGMPIVVYHPEKDGQNISARDPDVLNKQGIGTVLRASSNGKLVAEGWIDVENVKRIDRRVHDAIERGDTIELSTGLYLDTDPASDGATANGTAYKLIAKNYRPDHLAVLPDQKGACSLDDGCGVNVNQELEEEEGDEEDKEEEEVEGENASDDSKKASKKKVMAKNKASTKPAKPADYVTVNSRSVKMAKLTDQERAKLIDGLIANCDCWEEEDREVLNAKDDRELQLFEKAATSGDRIKTLEGVVNKAKEGVKIGDALYALNDEGQWLQHSDKQGKRQTINIDDLPDEMQSQLRYAAQLEKERKDELIETILRNRQNPWTREQLADMNRELLEPMAKLATIPPPEPRTRSYLGQTAPLGNVQNDGPEPMVPIDWDAAIAERAAR